MAVRSTPGIKALSKISDSVQEREHRYCGFNFFDDEDQTLFELLCRGEFLIHGFAIARSGNTSARSAHHRFPTF